MPASFLCVAAGPWVSDEWTPSPFQILFLRGITMKQVSLWSSDFLDLFQSCFDLPIKVTMPPSFYWWQAMVVEQCNLVKDVLTHSWGLHLMVFKGPSQPKPVWFCDLLTGIWNTLHSVTLGSLWWWPLCTKSLRSAGISLGSAWHSGLTDLPKTSKFELGRMRD